MRRACCLVAAGSVLSACAHRAAGVDPLHPPDRHDQLVVSSAAGAGLDTGTLRQLSVVLASDSFPKTTSVLIARRGTLAFEQYVGAGSETLLNDTRSATKSITALAVGDAIADGGIASVHTPAFGLLADLRPFANESAAKDSITIQDLLTMSSSLDCNDDVSTSPGNEDHMHPNREWTRWAVDLPVDSSYRRDSTGLGPWRYCTAGAFLLGQIVQRAVGQRVDHYVERRILTPLGITQWQWPTSPSDEVMTGGGLRLRSRDLMKLALLTLNDGAWNGRPVVPARWIHETLTVRRSAYPPQGYGYFFWERRYESRCGSVVGWFMAGNGGNAVVVFKDLDAVAVITRTNFGQREMHRQTQALLEHYVLPALTCSQPPGRP